MLPREDRVTRSTHKADNLADVVVHFVVSFVRVIRTLQLYPADHRFVNEAFEELVKDLKNVLGLRERVTFGFRDDAVLFDDQVLLRGHPTVASLRHYLEEKNIESFTVDREVELCELRSLAQVLAKHHHEVMKDGRVEDRHLRGVRSIRLNEVNYRRLEPGESPDDPLALARLEEHGYLVQSDDEAWRLRVPLFDQWLRRYRQRFPAN